MTQVQYTDDDLRRVAGLTAEMFDDKLAALYELASDVQRQVQPIAHMQEDITELKSDIKIVKAAVTDTNVDLHKVERKLGIAKPSWRKRF